MRLQQKFEMLEDLLINHRESIGIHNGVPFIMLIYSPVDELDCRKEIKKLKEKLDSRGIKTLEIPMNKFIFEHLVSEGILESMFEYDKESPKEVREDLFKRTKEHLKDYILKEIRANTPEVTFITRVASLHPYYRVSNLLYSLEGHIKKPLVVFYPGEFKNGKLHFLGEFESNEYYRAQRI